jgi:hypothetical protein
MITPMAAQSKPPAARVVKALVRLCWRFKTVAMGYFSHAPDDITFLLGAQRLPLRLFPKLLIALKLFVSWGA